MIKTVTEETIDITSRLVMQYNTKVYFLGILIKQKIFIRK